MSLGTTVRYAGLVPLSVELAEDSPYFQVQFHVSSGTESLWATGCIRPIRWLHNINDTCLALEYQTVRGSLVHFAGTIHLGTWYLVGNLCSQRSILNSLLSTCMDTNFKLKPRSTLQGLAVHSNTDNAELPGIALCCAADAGASGPLRSLRRRRRGIVQ